MNCIDVLLSTDTVFESFSKLLFGFGLQSLFSIEDITISNYLFLSLVCSHQQCHILAEPLILQRSTTCVNRQVFVTVYDQEISWFKHNICIVGKSQVILKLYMFVIPEEEGEKIYWEGRRKSESFYLNFITNIW